jgi:hypothetical protein
VTIETLFNKRNEQAGPGRPKKDIDLEQLEKLCELQVTQPEIASFFRISLATVERLAKQPKVRAAMDRGYLMGKISVRRRQMQLMEAGNTTMAIWLGKQLLDQRDQVDSRISNPDGSPLIPLAAWRDLVKAAKIQDAGE